MSLFGRFILISNHMIKPELYYTGLITDLGTIAFALIIQSQGGVRAITNMLNLQVYFINKTVKSKMKLNV